MPEIFRQKLSPELENQVNEVSEELEQSMVQASKKEEVLHRSLAEIKEKYPARYEMYVKTLRANRGNFELSEEERRIITERLAVLNNLDGYIENHYHNGARTLRERQITVFEDMRDFFEQGGKDGYIKLPTGAGKTVIFSEFIEATRLKTLIVVPTRILVGQTEERLEEFAEDLDVGKIYTDAKTHGEDVTIITYQSLLNKLADGTIKPEDYKCLILDEVHTSLTERRIEAIDKFKQAIRLGFTATPKYSADKNVGQVLNTEIHNLGVREAAEEGVVSPFSVILVETNIDTSNVKVTKGGEYDEQELEKVINTTGRNNAAVEIYEKMFKGQLAVAYCSGIEHAKNVAKLFCEKGIQAEVISGKQNHKEQEELLKQFKKGEIKVLCNADILITGFDEPKASVCLNLRPTLSAVVAEQRGGRVLRLNSKSPAKHAHIVDFIDKSENKKAQPITFAEIAGASVAYQVSAYTNQGKGGTEGVKDEGQEIEVEGVRIVTNSEEVMRVVGKIMEQKAEPAPEGWLALSELSREVNKTNSTVRNHVYVFKSEHPDWFREYLDKISHLQVHFSPELVEIIKEQLGEREKAPAGWMTNTSIAREIERDPKKTKKIADKYREQHPEWFSEYLDKAGKSSEHYSPQLIEKIISELSINAEDKAPEGWITNNKLSVDLGVAQNTVLSLAEPYRKTNPEWFKKYIGHKNRSREHYAPELVMKIRGQLEDRKLAPAGWSTVGAIGNKNEVSDGFVAKLAAKYRDTNPGWFKNYHTPNNKYLEHYSPELIEKIVREIKSRQEAPEGWVTFRILQHTLVGVSPEKLEKKLNEYRQAHSGWFLDIVLKSGKYAGQICEYYSPELTRAIAVELQIGERAPAGWMVNSNLAEELNISPSVTAKIAETYRQSNVTWFKTYLDEINRPREFYSPELVMEIKKQLQAREPAPKGWLTAGAIADKIGVGNELVVRFANKHRNAHPDWMKKYLTKEGKYFEHYSPGLIEALIKEKKG